MLRSSASGNKLRMQTEQLFVTPQAPSFPSSSFSTPGAGTCVGTDCFIVFLVTPFVAIVCNPPSLGKEAQLHHMPMHICTFYDASSSSRTCTSLNPCKLARGAEESVRAVALL